MAKKRRVQPIGKEFESGLLSISKEIYFMDEGWGSVWDHLDDLRQTIIRTFLVVGICFLIALALYQPIFQVFTDHPFVSTKGAISQENLQRIKLRNQTPEIQSIKLPQQALIVSNGKILQEKGGEYILAPGEEIIYEQSVGSQLLIMGPIEGMVLVFKVCLWLSVVTTAPVWGWIWLQFILPGLKSYERSVLWFFLVGSLSCVMGGIAIAYFITLPLANAYLMIFNDSIGQNAWTLKYYVNYVLFLFMGHSIAAELSLLLLVLVHFRYFSSEWLISKRRHMIVVAFVLGALLTPPDILTQFMLAIPLIAIYEIAILYARWRSSQIKT